MVEIYNSYEDEPKDHFAQLDEELYGELYEHEMSSFSDDLTFYTKNLLNNSTILELGVGTGRLADKIHKLGFTSIGVDISLPLLKIARDKSAVDLVCMDITNLSFSKRFNNIFAPYNLFNLLTDKIIIQNTLSGIEEALEDNGYLSAEIFILADNSELAQKGKSFQFQIIDYSDGRIIKEIIRTYIPNQKHIEVEERYRLRPQSGSNEDYSNNYNIAAFSLNEWLKILEGGNLKIKEQFGDYDLSPLAPNNNRLLVTLQKY